MLEKKRYQVRGAGTGEEALEQLETGTPADLVLTDLKMPGMGGMEFLRRLKQKWPDTEVLVMTAYGSIDTASRSDALRGLRLPHETHRS